MFRIDTLQITAEILGMISEIDEFKGAWRALGTLAPQRLNALRHVATIESIGSSTRIEGSKLTDRDVEHLLSNIEIKSFSSRDEQEVAGYAKIMELIFRSWEHIPFTENYIRQLHKDLLIHSSKDEYHRGNYKKSSNSIAAFDAAGKQVGVIFETATPYDTPILMQELVTWTREALEIKRLHPLLVIGIFIVVFLEIHPFQDGNGRLSRVLTTLLLLQSNYSYVPYSSLESIIENNKDSYYLALHKTQGTIRTNKPNWQPWVLFFLQSLSKQKQNLNAKVEQEKLMLTTLPDLTIKILDHAKQYGRVTMNDMIIITGVSRNTLKDHFRRLVKKNYLKQHGLGKTTWYTLA